MSVNKTSATDWEMTVRRDNVISITLRRLLMTNLLIRYTTQSSSSPVFLTRLSEPRSRPKILEVPGIEPATVS